MKCGRIDIGMYGSRENGLRRVWFDDVVAATGHIGPRIASER